MDSFGSEITRDYAPIFEELEHRKWMEKNNDEIKIIGLGNFLIPLIQSMFSQKRLNDIREESQNIKNTARKIIKIMEE